MFRTDAEVSTRLHFIMNNLHYDVIIIIIIIIITREQHSRKTRSQGTPENSHIGYCTHTSESTNVKKYNSFNTETNDISTMYSNNRIAATLYSLGTQFVSGIYKYKYPA